MTSLIRFFTLACTLLLAAALFGCGSADESTTLGDWTLKNDSLQLTETLRVSETEAFYFGTANELDVMSDGRLVVVDRKASNLKLLRPDGSLVDTLGGPGKGPGEFQGLIGVEVARGDSIYAHDLRQSRITVFSGEAPYDVERVVSIRSGAGLTTDLSVLDNGFVASFTSQMPLEEGIVQPDPSTVRFISDSGTSTDTLLLERQAQMAMALGGGGRPTVERVPFSRRTAFAVGPRDRLYSGWTDSLHIRAHTLTGKTEAVASIPAEPVPITEANRDSALSDLSDEMRSVIGPAMPDAKPAFTNMTVADDGRIWVERPPERPDAETATWWVLDSEAKTIREAQLPADTDIDVVRDGVVYGTTTTDVGAPAVVRYQIES